ncbi:hypothetical protein EC988_007383, partial [Linderina pennispora]
MQGNYGHQQQGGYGGPPPGGFMQGGPGGPPPRQGGPYGGPPPGGPQGGPPGGRASAGNHGFQWVSCSNGHIPPNAVQGGIERDGKPLFVARAMYKGGLHPGKAGPHIQKG